MRMTAQHDEFEAWWYRTFDSTFITNFGPLEFLIATDKNYNTFPPRDLWANIIPVVTLLQVFRNWVGYPVEITSAYRTEAYNASLVPPGSVGSQHISFRAVDIVVHGRGVPISWAQTFKILRDEYKLFKGAIGVYDGHVHVDTRGENVWFDSRTAKFKGHSKGLDPIQLPSAARFRPNYPVEPPRDDEAARLSPEPTIDVPGVPSSRGGEELPAEPVQAEQAAGVPVEAVGDPRPSAPVFQGGKLPPEPIPDGDGDEDDTTFVPSSSESRLSRPTTLGGIIGLIVLIVGVIVSIVIGGGSGTGAP